MKRIAFLLTLCLILAPLTVHAQSYEWLPAAIDKFDNPLYLTNAGDGSGRLFVVEQGGIIWIVNDGVLVKQPFLDIVDKLPDEVFRGGYTERGLLGLAFHPDYKNNGLFYVVYSRRDKTNVLARYHVSADDPNRADPDSETILLSYEHPEMNHNGGMIAFGPDGYLYMASGDGGGVQGDPPDYAQNKSLLFGKLLRIDINKTEGERQYAIPPDNPFVNDPQARPELWAYGLRNPWRFSFDRETGDLFIADVGWGRWEEIDYQPAGTPGGRNYGWNRFEGTHAISGRDDPGGVTMPIAEYDHLEGACSITGGYLYRGPGAPSLRGKYIFGDYCSGQIWTLTRLADDQWQMDTLMNMHTPISSFGEDERGGLYLVTYKGYIYRLREY
ncbi:MAG: PQQ-dependent sugar dehydrogenase [Anaerolineae bacterium]|nr:PQQ-dependent sugar dehydrogenase [Anaerolineae bacterium]